MGKFESKFLKATDTTKEQSWGSSVPLQYPAIAPHLITQIITATTMKKSTLLLTSPTSPFPLVAFYRPLPTYLPLLDNSATWQGLQGLPPASQPAPSPGPTAVLGHPDGCSLPEDNWATVPREEAQGRISWETEVLSRAESALSLPRENPGMNVTKHDVSAPRK